MTNTGEGWVGCLLHEGTSTAPGTLLYTGPEVVMILLCAYSLSVAMAVAWRSNAQQAGSQDLATVAGSEVRPSLRGWFSGTGGAGWFWGEN